ncbi:ABC transporter substrate-binding protein [Thermocatellispora tengchongensis]|uniref:ABC transporter substrate-binding protein n=1 Tax=Thermocatellispora tengchongensis TaxID=1073253 RepID=UPI003639CDF6
MLGRPGESSGDTLTIGLVQQPLSLDPAKTNTGASQLIALAYDTLIVKNPDGSLSPGIATDWSYVGSGNTRFELTIREGVTFADGTPLDAEAVAKSITYFKGANGPPAATLAAVKTAKALSATKVRLDLSAPNPVLPQLLSQDYLAGAVINPKATENPAQLGADTFGAGPYLLDKGATVIGDHFTLVPNPKYWNPPAVKWDKIVFRVIANPSALLGAMQTGQVDVAQGDASTADKAEAAGLKVLTSPAGWNGLFLMDRSGEVCPALGDQSVRQALNHAIDRRAIARALLGKYGGPTVQPQSEGWDNYDPALESRYPYDPEKAKELLASSGHKGGVSISVVVTQGPDAQLVQAVGAYLSKVGVELDVTTAPTFNDFVSKLTSKKFCAFTTPWGGQPAFIQAGALFLPGGVGNPFGVIDEQVADLVRRAAAAPAEESGELYRRMQARIVDLAWFVPVVRTDTLYYVGDGVTGVETTGAEQIPYPLNFRPS